MASVYGSFYILNHIPGIDAAWTYQLAFPAHHAFGNFFSKTFCFAPLDQQIDFPWIEIGQPGCRTSGSTATATNTPFERWFMLCYKLRDREIIIFEVNLSSFQYGISPILHDRIIIQLFDFNSFSLSHAMILTVAALASVSVSATDKGSLQVPVTKIPGVQVSF